MDSGQDHGLSRVRVRRQIDGSLKRLGVERVALYMAHSFDPDTPQEETLRAFDELVRTGKVGAVGASNFSAEQLAEAVEISELEGLTRYEWAQNSYSLLDRADVETVFPVCHEHGLGYEAFGPLAGGWLTGKYRRGEELPSRITDDAAARLVPAVRERPGLHGPGGSRGRGSRTRRLDGRARDRVAPRCARDPAVIVGPTRAEHLEPVREALSLELTSAECAHLQGLFT